MKAQSGSYGEKKQNAVILTAAFAVPFLIMFAIFIINGIYPFGDRSFLFSDMYHQYMPFFSEFLRKIKAGEGLSYSYQVGIGSNFLALYVYYLASPLHWLAFLFPENHLMEFMSYLVIVKIGLCGLTSCIYLEKHFGQRRLSMVFFSVFYALSGFMAAYNWDIMWIDCVVLLPLIMLGLEQLVKEGRCSLYCITLGLSILSNYYISIMICIFLVLYFLVLLFLEKCSFRIIRNFILYSLLAGGMAAALLVPEVLAILETDFGDMDFPKKLESYFSVLDMLARHCMCVSCERGLDHWPNIYCGAAVMMLIPMYVINGKIPARKRFGYLALAGIFLLGFATNMLDFIWHGLNYPDSLPARQSFIYIFIVLIMCYAAFQKVKEVPASHIVYGYLAAVVFLLYCEKFVDHEDFELGIKALTLGFVTLYAVLLYLYRTRGEEKAGKYLWKKEILAAIAFCAVVAESGINTFNTSVGTTSRSQYLNQLPDYASLYEAAKTDAQNGEEEGAVFFRVEKFSRKTKNDGTLAGYPTASVFSSTLNSYVMDLYQKLGMRHSKVYYGFDGATFLTAGMLNVQYMFGTDRQEEGPFYTFLEESGQISLYRAEETLPFGYTAPVGFDLPNGYGGNGLRLQNALVKELGVEGNLFTKVSGASRQETIKTDISQTGYYYGILTASGTRQIKVEGSVSRSLNDLKNGAVLYLGYFKEGQSVSLKNGDEADETPEISADIYRMDEEVLKAVLEKLSETHLTNVAYDSTNISGEITLTEAKRLILSVPYEKGWQVEIDGKKVTPELFGGTLMAFDLEEGQHSLTMHYVPHGKTAGICISIFSIVIFAGIQLFNRKSEGRRKDSANGKKAEESGTERECTEEETERRTELESEEEVSADECI